MKKKYYIVYDFNNGNGKGAVTKIVKNVGNDYMPTIDKIMEWQEKIEKYFNFIDVTITNFIEIGFDNE